MPTNEIAVGILAHIWRIYLTIIMTRPIKPWSCIIHGRHISAYIFQPFDLLKAPPVVLVGSSLFVHLSFYGILH